MSNNLTMRNVAAVVTATLLLTARPSAFCGPPPPTCEALATADVVFYGEVLEATYHPDYFGPNRVSSDGHQDLRFTVLRAFKGVVNGVFGGAFRTDSNSIRFAEGLAYVVFASQKDGLWLTSCSRTSEIIARIRIDEVQQIRELVACPKPPPIR